VRFDLRKSGLETVPSPWQAELMRFVWGGGDYIVEDIINGGLRNVTGVNFTDQSKEAMATCLKEQMRSSVCPGCGWEGYVDPLGGSWRTTCPRGCQTEEGNARSLRHILHISFDEALYHELNVERYEFSKSGKIIFNYSQGTKDYRFWAVDLAVYATEHSKPAPSTPIARIV